MKIIFAGLIKTAGPVLVWIDHLENVTPYPVTEWSNICVLQSPCVYENSSPPSTSSSSFRSGGRSVLSSGIFPSIAFARSRRSAWRTNSFHLGRINASVFFSNAVRTVAGNEEERKAGSAPASLPRRSSRKTPARRVGLLLPLDRRLSRPSLQKRMLAEYQYQHIRKCYFWKNMNHWETIQYKDPSMRKYKRSKHTQLAKVGKTSVNIWP